MNLDIATSIRYPDGEVAGTIEKVVFDPQTNEVHEVILSTPGLLSRMVIVPVALLREDPGEVVVIDADSDALEALPDYEVDRYLDAPEGWAVSPNYAPGASLFPATIYYPMAPILEETNAPEGTIELGQGTEVLCSDGRYGIVDEIVLGEDGITAVALVVRPDDEFSPDIEVPMELVESADALVVVLRCTIAELPTLGTPIEHELEEPETNEIL